jgi:hypothetical protein
MGEMKQLMIDDESNNQIVLMAEPANLYQSAYEIPVRLVSKTFHINGVTGGGISVQETHDGSSVKVMVQNARNRAEISLDYQSFRELSHLLYDVNLNRSEARPF